MLFEPEYLIFNYELLKSHNDIKIADVDFN